MKLHESIYKYVILKSVADQSKTDLNEFLATIRIEFVEEFTGTLKEVKNRIKILRKEQFGIDYMNEKFNSVFHIKKL